MKCISIQLQPDIDPTLNKEAVLAVLTDAGLMAEIVEGEDEGRFINLNVNTDDVKLTWQQIKKPLLQIPYIQTACIIVCEGNHGWNDFLLLHHYDPAEVLDEL